MKKKLGYAIEFELEWSSDGNKILENTKGV